MLPIRKWLFAFLCTACLAAPASRADAETCGIIITHQEAFHEKAHTTFLSRLSDKGYKGRLKFIVQRPHPDPIAWSNAARKLIAANVDFIITYGVTATLSALHERPDIPIIYADVYEPLARGIKAKDATGVCSKYSVSSMLRYLRTASLSKNIGVVYSAFDEGSRYQHGEIVRLSKKYGLNITSMGIRNPMDTVGILSEADVGSFLITSSSLVRSVFPTILRIAENKKIPVASLIYHDNRKPMIMLSANPEEQGQEVAEKLMRLLSGVPLKDVPASCSKKIELVFKVGDAQRLGVRMPMDLVTEATSIVH
jgi:putative ABC transport system substrate-binding protein